MFPNSTRTLFTGKDKHRDFFDWLARKMDHKNMEDWYSVTEEEIHRNGATKILKIYDNSLPTALSTVYSEHVWVNWKFCTGSPSIQKQKKKLGCIENELGSRELNDWRQVSAFDEIVKMAGDNGNSDGDETGLSK